MNFPDSCGRSSAADRASIGNSISAAAVSAAFSFLAYGARADPTCQISGDTATCNSQGNPFSDGIVFGSDAADPIKIVIGDSVNIETNLLPGISLTGSGDLSVDLESGLESFSITTTGDITSPRSSYGIYAKPSNDAGSVSIKAVDIKTSGSTADGIHVKTKNGGISITSTGLIDVSGLASRAVYAGNSPIEDSDGNKIVTGPITITVNNVTSSADHTDYGLGAAVYAHGAGRINITSSGRILTTGDENSAIRVFGRIIEQEDNTISINANNIHTYGARSFGIIATGIGRISFTSSGSIVTEGEKAYGMNAETSDRTGSEIVFSVNDIKTSGQSAHAMRATAKGLNQVGDDVTITVSGNVETLGKNAHGVFAHSQSGGVRITVAKTGSIVSLNSGANAIYLREREDKFDNEVHLSEPALITNHGRIAGSMFSQARGASTLNNFGMFEPGDTVNLGGSGQLVNSGLVSPGGSSGGGAITAVDLTGNFKQSESGTLELNADWRNKKSDSLAVSGSAELDGELRVISRNKPAAGEDNRVSVLTAGEGISGENELTLKDTVLIDYSIQKFDLGGGTGHRLDLTASLREKPEELNRNQKEVLDTIPDQKDVLQETETEELKDSLDDFGNELAAAPIISSLFSSLSFNEDLDSCARSKLNLNGFAEGGLCTWATVFEHEHKSPETSKQVGYTEGTKAFSAGLRHQISGEPFGVSAGAIVETGNLAMDSNSTASLRRQQAGIKVYYRTGGFRFSLGTTFGSGEHDMLRYFTLNGSPEKVTGRQNIAFIGLHSEIRRELDLGSWTVAPSLLASVFSATADPYSERGESDYRLDVEAASLKAAVLRPSIVFERSFKAGDFEFLPSIGISSTKIFEGSTVVNSKFAGGESFPARVSAHSSSIDVSARLGFSSGRRNLSGELSYSQSRSQSDGDSISRWSGKISYRF